MKPGSRPRKKGRFTLLMSPTLFALFFLLLGVLCDRQNRQMDPFVIHPLAAERLSGYFHTAAAVSSLVACPTALWLALRGKGDADTIAMGINALTAMFGLLNFFMVT